jgi:hypothetical protein
MIVLIHIAGEAKSWARVDEISSCSHLHLQVGFSTLRLLATARQSDRVLVGWRRACIQESFAYHFGQNPFHPAEF